jgi:hypothetical protein
MLEIRGQLPVYTPRVASLSGKQNFSPILERLWEGRG